MHLSVCDFNGAEEVVPRDFTAQWHDLESVLGAMPLHLKASDQKDKKGTPVFDPVGTNAAIKVALKDRGWATNILIPKEISFLGQEVDFFRDGLLVEVQFPNYPFLLNNVVRSALLAKSRTVIAGSYVRAVVVVTKKHLLPSANSTLYFEQAVSQLSELSKHGVFNVPIRVVGISEEPNTRVKAIWTDSPGRYSRDLSKRREVYCEVTAQERGTSICRLRIVSPPAERS